MIRKQTFSADASQVGDLHQHLGEHVRFVGPSLPHVNLQRLQKWLLQDVHFVCLFQVLPICEKNKTKKKNEVIELRLWTLSGRGNWRL